MEYEALNENFRNRGRRVEEQIAVLRALWTDELVTFEGKWHHLDRMGLNPMPIQRPIPIWMGTYTQLVEVALQRVGRLGDGWFPQFPPGDELRGALERLRGYAAAAGRDPAAIGIEGGLRVAAGDDPDAWVKQVAAWDELGATHLRLNVSGVETMQQRLDLLRRVQEATRGL
jgi:alkanesulfonate monooxygenase SsuD/methylene tetrahydromethanopterin reductase-like flavin-dependent oxidoreductase (luciferase family)